MQKKTVCDLISSGKVDPSAIDEEVWEEILSDSDIPAEKLTDEIVEYLISNNIAVIQLAHLPLSEKWLIKLSEYDTMPLYRLGVKYYTDEAVSEQKFTDFFKEYLVKCPDMIATLLQHYQSSKKSTLIHLCKKSDIEQLQECGREYALAEYIKKSEDSDEILKVYEENKNNSVILEAIAENRFSGFELLLKLTETKGISGAKKVRISSRETIKKYFYN